jgi:hypothetical protein
MDEQKRYVQQVEDDFKTLQHKLTIIKQVADQTPEEKKMLSIPNIRKQVNYFGPNLLNVHIQNLPNNLGDDSKWTIEDWATMSDEILVSKFGPRTNLAKTAIQKHLALVRKVSDRVYDFELVVPPPSSGRRFVFPIIIDKNGLQCEFAEDLILQILTSEDYDKTGFPGNHIVAKRWLNKDPQIIQIRMRATTPSYLVVAFDDHSGIEDQTKVLLKECVLDQHLKSIVVTKSSDVSKPILSGIQGLLGASSLFPPAAAISGLLSKAVTFVGDLYQYIKSKNFKMGIVKIDPHVGQIIPIIVGGAQVTFQLRQVTIDPLVAH